MRHVSDGAVSFGAWFVCCRCVLGIRAGVDRSMIVIMVFLMMTIMMVVMIMVLLLLLLLLLIARSFRSALSLHLR